MRRLSLAVVVVLAACAGCGGPASPREQAEALGGVAAEGALLASDVSAGRSAGPFARVHAGVLADQAAALRRDGETPAVRDLAGRVDALLRALAASPARADADRLARSLRRADRGAGRLETRP